MNRYPNWQTRLDLYLRTVNQRQFKYGEWDCCLFACDAIQEMTGTVTSYSGSTLVANITSTAGSGSGVNWVLSISPCPMISVTIQTSQTPIPGAQITQSGTMGSGVVK